jgi:hypothetical protein
MHENLHERALLRLLIGGRNDSALSIRAAAPGRQLPPGRLEPVQARNWPRFCVAYSVWYRRSTRPGRKFPAICGFLEASWTFALSRRVRARLAKLPGSSMQAPCRPASAQKLSGKCSRACSCTWPLSSPPGGGDRVLLPLSGSVTQIVVVAATTPVAFRWSWAPSACRSRAAAGGGAPGAAPRAQARRGGAARGGAARRACRGRRGGGEPGRAARRSRGGRSRRASAGPGGPGRPVAGRRRGIPVRPPWRAGRARPG